MVEDLQRLTVQEQVRRPTTGHLDPQPSPLHGDGERQPGETLG
jgi:hypothetical protein